MKPALLIPIFEPSDDVVPFLMTFQADEFSDFLVINDGSDPKFDVIYREIEEKTPFRVEGYPKNQGKGAALKYGLKKLLERNPDLEGFITADGDGQHAKDDILALRDALEANPDAMHLGVRDFNSPSVPKRSRFGNKFSCGYFQIATGVRLTDTQTGLRAIPVSIFPLFLSTGGERYEFEMNFLMLAARNIKIEQHGIQTIYEDDNAVSHFRPVRDAMRIYRTPILYGLVSVLSWVIDIGMFALLSSFAFTETPEIQVFASTAIARVLSGTFNFLSLAFVVFPKKGETLNKLWKYLVTFSLNLVLSGGLTYLFRALPTGLTVLKIIIDTFIAVANYFINLVWTFAGKRIKKKKDKPNP
ncbi:MAG: bifunctional glycosyltransferase family 2/GtrA family protein [Bacilli bacterium]|nr:bifunctional glycosyltransferase family 2/GtrA family protein [Bacilli bacterium]